MIHLKRGPVASKGPKISSDLLCLPLMVIAMVAGSDGDGHCNGRWIRLPYNGHLLFICRCKPPPPRPWCPSRRTLCVPASVCVVDWNFYVLIRTVILWLMFCRFFCAAVLAASLNALWERKIKQPISQIRHHCQDHWPHSPTCIGIILINVCLAIQLNDAVQKYTGRYSSGIQLINRLSNRLTAVTNLIKVLLGKLLGIHQLITRSTLSPEIQASKTQYLVLYLCCQFITAWASPQEPCS